MIFMNRYIEINQSVFEQVLLDVKNKLRLKGISDIELIWKPDKSIQSVKVIDILNSHYSYVLFGVINIYESDNNIVFREFSDNNREELSELFQLIDKMLGIKVKRKDEDAKCRLGAIYCESLTETCSTKTVDIRPTHSVLLEYQFNYT